MLSGGIKNVQIHRLQPGFLRRHDFHPDDGSINVIKVSVKLVQKRGILGRCMVAFYCVPVFLVLSCSSANTLYEKPVSNVVKFRTVGSIPIIVATLNGKQAIFIIDTGASVSVINESEARHFNIRIRNNDSAHLPSHAVGFGGKQNLNIAFNCDIELGGRKINSTVFNSKDLRDLGIIVGRGEAWAFGGIIGSDLLTRYRMNIDFATRMITFQ